MEHPQQPLEEPSPARRWSWAALEALVAIASPALLLAVSVLIRVNPRERLGQISGLAALELRYFLFAIALIVVLVLALRMRGSKGFELTSRLVCAAVAGLATGLVGAGILVALRGTPWGLHTQGGDVTALTQWATALNSGESIPPLYPPLSLHVLAKWSTWIGLPPEQAIKHLQIAGTAAFGPVAYLSWRLLLRPGWALGIGVVAVLPLIDPYKPYTHLVLAAFLPLSLLFLKVLRDIGARGWQEVAQISVGFGLAFGVLCLAYSGWFKWSAPGMLVATLVVFPWRTAPRKGLALLAMTGAGFVLVAGQYLAGVLLDPSTKVVDKFIYFDVRVEPMYIAMWRNDLQGVLSQWPPLGELGGVGLYTIVLLVGMGLSIAYGRGNPLVIGLGSVMAGAWLFRFWYARSLWETRLVQLYPRTTPLILYILLVMTGLAAYWIAQRRSEDSPLRGRAAQIGAVCALLLFFASTGSSIVDRYMPSNTTPPGPGFLAWNAHQAHRATRPKIHRARTMWWERRALSVVATPPSPAAPGP